MSAVTKAIRFHFINFSNRQIIIAVAILLLNLLISIAVIRLVNASRPAGSNDMTVLVWIFILGLIFFAPSFKYLLSQGMSRRRLFLAMSSSIALLAAAFAILSTIFYAISLKVAKIMMLYEVIYHDQSIINVLIWEFAALLFLGVLGWLIGLVYYRSDRKTQLVVTFTPLVLASLLIFFNALVDGGIGRGVWDFLKIVMGFTFSIPNSFMGAASMTVAAAIMGIPIWLLLRRAQIKD
jgi:hypothetical protein